MRKTEFTGLLIDFEELHLDLVALLDAGVFHRFEAFPRDFGDVQETFFRRHELNEATVGHDAHYLGVIDFAHLGDGHDGADLCHGGIDAVLVGSRNLDLAHAVFFVDRDGGTGFFLHALDDLTSGSNNGADEFLGNFEGFDAGHMGLVVFAGMIERFHHLAENVFATGFGLCERLFENLVGKAVALDVHLRSRETFERSRGLEVHIAQVIFVTEDVGEHSILVFAGILDETHGNTRDGCLERHTGVHQREGSGANRGHRRRTVGFENITYHTNGVREVGGDLSLQAAPCQVAVSDFATADTALRLGFAGGEGGEVVVKEEAHVALVEHIVYHFLVEFRAERGGAQALCLTAGENGRAVRTGQGIHFAPNGANVRGLAAVEAYTLVENATTHGVFLHIVVVAVDERVLFGQFVLTEIGMCGGVSLFEGFAHSFEGVETFVLLECGLRDVVAFLVALGFHLFAQLFVVDFVAVFALHVLAEFFRQLLLEAAHGFDGLVCGFEGFEEGTFRHFVHFAFHHHDVFFGSTHHEVHVGAFELFESRVDDEITVDAGHTHLRNRTVEGDIGTSQGCRGGKTGECIGHVYTVGAEERDVDIHLGVIVGGEEGAEGTIHQARGEDLVVASTAFALGETTGEASHGRVLFFVVTLQRHEIGAGYSVFGTANGSEKHGVVHAQHHCAVGLLRELTGLDADGASVRQRDCFGNNVHLITCNRVMRKKRGNAASKERAARCETSSRRDKIKGCRTKAAVQGKNTK